MPHTLGYITGDLQPHGDLNQRLATCTCGAKDGRWFRKGAKADRQGQAFMAKHLRRIVSDPFVGIVDVKTNDGWDR